MRDRKLDTGLALAAALTIAACGHREQRVVDQYFGALNAGDNQTLAGFAIFKLEQKVDKWRIVSASDETSVKAPLPELVQTATSTQAKYDLEKKAVQNFALNDLNGYSQAQEIIKKGAKAPANLQDMVARLEAWSKRERELKSQIAEARSAADTERRIVVLSVGPDLKDIDTLEADQINKTLELGLTIGGQEQTWTMQLRRYKLKEETAQRVITRWVVQSLQKK
jgi:hypothetical protein